MKANSFISREQDYALRITAYLASLKKGHFISINKMADILHISNKFAARIVHKLKKANITDSIQGKYGGIFLKADPKEVSFWDIMNVIGFKMKFNDCLKENFICELEFGCKFHMFFVQQENKMKETLMSQKISDYLFSHFKEITN